MKVKIKKLAADAVIPKYATHGDAGMDMVAISRSEDEYGNVVYGTGLAFEIPIGFFMMLVPRGSNCKTDLLLTNHCGIVDSGYRGEVMFKYAPYRENDTKEIRMTRDTARMMDVPVLHKIGDRIGQLIIMPYPTIEFEEVTELSETERGTGGYGHTGR